MLSGVTVSRHRCDTSRVRWWVHYREVCSRGDSVTPVSVLVVSQSHSCSVCDMLQLVRDLLAVTPLSVPCAAAVSVTVSMCHTCLLTVIH